MTHVENCKARSVVFPVAARLGIPGAVAGRVFNGASEASRA